MRPRYLKRWRIRSCEDCLSIVGEILYRMGLGARRTRQQWPSAIGPISVCFVAICGHRQRRRLNPVRPASEVRTAGVSELFSSDNVSRSSTLTSTSTSTSILSPACSWTGHPSKLEVYIRPRVTYLRPHLISKCRTSLRQANGMPGELSIFFSSLSFAITHTRSQLSWPSSS